MSLKMHDTPTLLKAFGPALLPQVTKNIAITDDELEQQAKEIARLELALRQSRERHRQLKANRDRLLNSAAPINAPPPEILDRIFELGALESPHFAVLVSHVSNGWRERALRNPRLWNYIHSSSDYELDRLRVWIERSKACPLYIDLNLESVESMVSHFELIRPHISRWRSLSLSSPDPEVLRVVTSQLDQDALRLVSLNVTLDSDSPSEQEVDDLLTMKWSTPSLRHFSLIGVPMVWEADLPSTLESLVLGLNDESRAPSVNDIVSFLSRHPNLKSLSIHSTPGGVSIPEDSDDLRDRVELPHLQDLSLEFIRGDHLALKSLLSRIYAPALHTFELRTSAEFRSQPAFEVIGSARCPFPSVEHFKLANCDIHSVPFNNALRRLPNISRLTLESCHLDGTVLEMMSKSATQEGRGTMVVPRLRHLTMRLCSGLPSDAVKRLVLARMSYAPGNATLSTPSRIEVLEMERCTLSSMHNPWFKKNVPRFVWRI